MPYQNNVETAKLLISRLERLSADSYSYWAHRASGIRGALLKYIDTIKIKEEMNQSPKNADLNILIQIGYDLLEKAAREIPEQR